MGYNPPTQNNNQSIQTTTEPENNESSNKLSEMLMNAFESSISKRREHFSQNKITPNASTVDSVISHYSNLNAGISAGASIIPGPLGMATAIPEIGAVTVNQVKMIFDIGYHYGKDRFMTKELIAGILMSALGHKGIEILAISGTRVLVKRVSLRFFQSFVKRIGVSITQKAASSMVAKWLPLVGSVAMGAWSKISTKKIGEKAKEILTKDIVLEQEEQESETIAPNEEPIKESTKQITLNIDLLRVKTLVNFMKIDKVIDDREIECINTILGSMSLKDEEIADIKSNFHSPQLYDIEFSAIKESNEHSIGLITDLVALAKADEKIVMAEKMYLRKIAGELDVPFDDIEYMLDNEATSNTNW